MTDAEHGGDRIGRPYNVAPKYVRGVRSPRRLPRSFGVTVGAYTGGIASGLAAGVAGSMGFETMKWALLGVFGVCWLVGFAASIAFNVGAFTGRSRRVPPRS